MATHVGRIARCALLVLFSLGTKVPIALADSPLTSIDLASAYKDIPAVGQALQAHRVEGEVLAFLLSDAPTDEKAAVVNALGWKLEGQKNGLAYAQGLAEKKQITLEKLLVADCSPSERMVLGYLLALDDYFKLKPLRQGAAGLPGATPLGLLDSAAKDLPEDFTVAMIRGLIQAQLVMDKNWCKVYRASQTVIDAFAPAKRNLRQKAVASIEQYMGLYEKDCPGSKAEARVKKAQLNQIYALTQLGNQIVAGTQGGLVVWDPADQAPVAIGEEFICGHLVVYGGSVWAGCDKHVLRWDGQRMKPYLENKANDATYYAPMLGFGGALWVRYGNKTYAYEPAGDRFVSIAGKTPWSGDPYDVLVRSNGEVWWIDFLAAIHRDKARYQLKSETYPGSDPRGLRQDSQGRLWIQDFNQGFYRFEPQSNRFVQEAGVASKGSGLAYDEKREHLWLLHYTDGLVLVQNGRVLRTIELKDLQYMRDLLLDASGNLWVAGWNQLLRLQEKGGGFDRQSFRVE